MPKTLTSQLLRSSRSLQEQGGPPGAVVIGGDYQGLGIVRSLGRKGIPVCVIDDEHSIAKFSRYTSMAARVADLKDEDAIIKTLLDLGTQSGLQGWVLFPTRDELVAALSRHRSELSEIFRVPSPNWETVQCVWDKRNTYRIAQELNIPIPRTWVPASPDELHPADLPFPAAIKPAIKEHFFYATKAKAWRANSASELEILFKRATAVAGPGEIIVQDLIPGDGTHQFAYCAMFKEGKALGSMVTRRRRQHPHDFGRASTFVETIDLPALESLSQRFLRAIDYYGLVEIEFKLDPRDGQFKLLDVNARTWGYNALGGVAGVDFPLLLYVDQISGSVQPCRGRPGLSWIHLLTDIPTGLLDVACGRLRYRDYLQSLRNVHADAVFNREDPIPAFIECALVPYLTFKRGF